MDLFKKRLNTVLMLAGHNEAKINTITRESMPTPTPIEQYNATLLNYLHNQLPRVSEAETAFSILKRDSKQNQSHELLLEATLQRIEKCTSVNALRVLKDYFNQQAGKLNNNPIRTQRYMDWADACSEQIETLLTVTDQKNMQLATSETIAAHTRIAGIAFLSPIEKKAIAQPHSETARFTVHSAANAQHFAALTKTVSSMLTIVERAQRRSGIKQDRENFSQLLQKHLNDLPKTLTYNSKLRSHNAYDEMIKKSEDNKTHLNSLELCVMAHRDNKLTRHSAPFYAQALERVKQETLSQHGFWKVGAPSDQQQPTVKPPLHIQSNELTKKRKCDDDDSSPRKSQKSPPSTQELWQTEAESAAGLLIGLRK